MKTCNKCGCNFPFIIEIDGKNRNLQRRNLCLTCLPFGERQRNFIDKHSPKIITRECKHHGEVEFVLQATGYRCKKCRSKSVSDNRRSRKRRLAEALGNKCCLCGYDKCMDALDFHHVDPSQKSFCISHKGVTIAFERALEEAKKCVLVCANCHREIEAGIRTLSP